jgi:hypothetical protein
VVNSGEFLRRGHPSARLLGNCVVTNQHWFPEAARGLFRLKGDEPWLAGTGFQPLPFEEIGLYRDALRRKLPVRELAELRAGR